LQTLKDLVPSAKIEGQKVTLSLSDFHELVLPQISALKVDEVFYKARYPDVALAIIKGEIKSAREHFLASGFLEGRFPCKPDLDEAWYLQTYPDVAEGIRRGAHKSALDHYIGAGHYEGRLPKRPSK